LVENYLPGALKKYGMDYETLREINPRLIYASITGYGQTGPYSNRAGYDVMVEAEMGLMHITGARDGAPVKVGVAVTDLTTGLYTSNAIMAALIARGRTGRGQHIDACLSDCQVATLSNLASSALISGKKDSGRWGTAHRKQQQSLVSSNNKLTLPSIHCTLPELQDQRRRYPFRWWQ
jgi:succinate--hydroxymethylglutarate CoA-transferase